MRNPLSTGHKKTETFHDKQHAYHNCSNSAQIETISGSFGVSSTLNKATGGASGRISD